jgi:glycosyltransferase involved in cell wall biosynthesis
MNILFISSIQMWGGGLKERGHSVSLICRPKTELAQNASALGFDVHAIRIGGDFDPLVIWNARRIMKEKRINVICTNMDKDLRFGGIAAKLAGVRGIVPSREIDYPLKNTLRYRFAYNVLATKIVVNSKATQQTILASAPWLDAKRTKIIYKGIDLSRYNSGTSSNIRNEFHLPSSSPLVTFVGQLDERKGLHFLLEAWRSVHAEFPKAILFIVGKGKMHNEIEQFISRHNLKENIVLTGFRSDVPNILLQSSMLILPSLWEGFGYVLVEAMAAKLPTVATATSSIPEIVEHNKSGILVPPKNADALARAIASLLSDPSKAATMGLRGRQIVEEKFTRERMIDEFEKVFLSQGDFQAESGTV